MWRLSGIYRDVYLVAKPRQNIRDFFITTDLDENFQHAHLNINTSVKNFSVNGISDYELKATVFEKGNTGNALYSMSEAVDVSAGQEVKVNLNRTVSNPKLWSAEKPNLYTAVFELIDDNGTVVEKTGTHFGFREVEIQNKYNFNNINEFATSWELIENAKVIESGEVESPSIEPGLSASHEIPYQPELKPGKEYFLKVNFALAEDKLWAKSGHVVAWDQFPLQTAAPLVTGQIKSGEKLTLEDSKEEIVVKGQNFRVIFDAEKGELKSLSYDGEEMLASPVVPNFWRVPVDNDLGHNFDITSGAWRTTSDDRLVKSVMSTSMNGDIVLVSVGTELPVFAIPHKTTYTVYKSGAVKVNCSMDIKMDVPELPRFGVQFNIPDDYSEMKWYGRGLHETYQDRKTGAAFGIYSGKVDEQVYPYIFPQETGNKTDVRWATFTNENGDGIFIIIH